jgi:hypothetical protein
VRTHGYFDFLEEKKMAKRKPSSRLSSGREFDELDETPIEMPFNCKRPTRLQDMIATMVKEAVEAEKGDEFETMDEADDFTEEDPNLLDMSPYEFETIQDDYDSAEEYEPPVDDSSPTEPPPDDPPPTGDTPDPNESEPA